jgi:hypothetical protein
LEVETLPEFGPIEKEYKTKEQVFCWNVYYWMSFRVILSRSIEWEDV